MDTYPAIDGILFILAVIALTSLFTFVVYMLFRAYRPTFMETAVIWLVIFCVLEVSVATKTSADSFYLALCNRSLEVILSIGTFHGPPPIMTIVFSFLLCPGVSNYIVEKMGGNDPIDQKIVRENDGTIMPLALMLFTLGVIFCSCNAVGVDYKNRKIDIEYRSSVQPYVEHYTRPSGLTTDDDQDHPSSVP